MKKQLVRYLKVWWLMSRNSFVTVFYAKLALTIFLVGKIMRFLFFGSFLFFFVSGAKGLAGYSPNEVAFFFLTFNLVDIVGQFLFREVYRFRGLIVSGNFDLVLVKPINPLFRSLMGGADVIDLITIPPLLFLIWFVGRAFNPTFLDVSLFSLLTLNGVLISGSFYIFVLGFGIITQEIDHMTMIYRDLASLGRIPVDVYKEPMKAFLSFVFPVAIMVTLPARALVGVVTPIWVVGSLVIGIVSFYLAIKFWNFALKRYTSASS